MSQSEPDDPNRRRPPEILNEHDETYRFMPRNGAVTSRLRPWAGQDVTINGWFVRTEKDGRHHWVGYCREADYLIDERDLFPVIPRRRTQE